MNEPVFTPEQVERLWQHQFGPWSNPFERNSKFPPQMHPYTCANRGDHPEVAGDKGVLVPTVRGWICPFCDYTQNWAHGIGSATEDRKHIGYTEREEGFYKLYSPPKDSIVTQAFILCKYCNGAIYHCSGPKADAVCFDCYDKEPELR